MQGIYHCTQGNFLQCMQASFLYVAWNATSLFWVQIIRCLETEPGAISIGLTKMLSIKLYMLPRGYPLEWKSAPMNRISGSFCFMDPSEEGGPSIFAHSFRALQGVPLPQWPYYPTSHLTAITSSAINAVLRSGKVMFSIGGCNSCFLCLMGS